MTWGTWCEGSERILSEHFGRNFMSWLNDLLLHKLIVFWNKYSNRLKCICILLQKRSEVAAAKSFCCCPNGCNEFVAETGGRSVDKKITSVSRCKSHPEKPSPNPAISEIGDRNGDLRWGDYFRAINFAFYISIRVLFQRFRLEKMLNLSTEVMLKVSLMLYLHRDFLDFEIKMDNVLLCRDLSVSESAIYLPKSLEIMIIGSRPNAAGKN